MVEETFHYNNKRKRREWFIKNIIGGDGEIVGSFIVDKHHKNGKELHQVTRNGIVIIYNLHSGKLVTKLIARPQQIKRYYINAGLPIYNSIVEVARQHQLKRYNKI